MAAMIKVLGMMAVLIPDVCGSSSIAARPLPLRQGQPRRAQECPGSEGDSGSKEEYSEWSPPTCYEAKPGTRLTARKGTSVEQCCVSPPEEEGFHNVPADDSNYSNSKKKNPTNLFLN